MAKTEFIEIEEEQDESGEDLTEPFNPKDIDIGVEQRSLDSIFARLKHGKIDLNTEFQREGNLWSPSTMSRLIESLMVRFPLPAFYFDAGDDDFWLVIDGLQRLCTFKRFVVDCETPGIEPLKLVGLEFLKNYNGLIFSELPYNMQRRIRESQITAYFIKPGTPQEVKYSIFYRINTGGLILNAQEIRHALNQKGYASQFLKSVSEESVFKTIVSISPKRMQDRELILRHMAFRLHPYQVYKPPMKKFLNTAIEELSLQPREELDRWKSQFLSSLKTSEFIFGKHVFSKSIADARQNPTLNRGLFEVMTVLLAEMPDEQKELLVSQKEKFLEAFKALLNDTDFNSSITSATTESAAVKERFERIKQLFSIYTRK